MDGFTSNDPQSVVLFPSYGMSIDVPMKDNLSDAAKHTYAISYRVTKMLGGADKLAHKEAMKKVKELHKMKGGVWQ